MISVLALWRRLKDRIKKRRPLALAIVAGLVVVAAICHYLIFPLPESQLFKAHSVFVYDRRGTLLSMFTSSDRFWRKPVKIHEISPLLVRSVIECEDRWFYYHPGVNPVSLISAAVENILAGTYVRGGSTITMQIARMMEPKERTISGKCIEILRAFQLELTYSKAELLELYFNLAPYGGNIEGIGAASQLYLGKSSANLTLSECALMTAVPSSPNRFRPDRNSPASRERREEVLDVLVSRGVIDSVAYEQAREEEIPLSRLVSTSIAPHFCQSIAQLAPEASEIQSTIDYNLQVMCERMARVYQNTLHQSGIHNLSLVVLDNKTGELRAMVGSADFTDVAHHGQVNGALAPRSPGSALKPFVYGIAFDKGVVSPSLMLEDLPINYAGYMPENFDEEYRGLVSVRDALAQSLNVPAVNLASQTGLSELYSFLRRGGITTLTRPWPQYGLPLVLGSCEVNLLELSNLYAMLARQGEYIPWRCFKEESPHPSVRLLSSESSWLITDILTELKRPDLPTSWEFTTDMPKVAWKTGTSYGRKDAWAIGYNPEYTIGVWAGNFSAEGSVSLVGAEVSAPLVLTIFDQLYNEKEAPWFTKPSSVSVHNVCAVSGMPASEDCETRISDFHIEGVTDNHECIVHERLLVDQSTGYQLCPSCRHGRKTREMVVEHWPPRQAAWRTSRGTSAVIPPHNPLCTGEFNGDNPVIVSPENGAVYALRSRVPGKYQQLLIEATGSSDSRTLHWFLDGALLSKTASGEKAFCSPKRGEHQLVCVDSYGRSSKVSFLIE
ncbi:MAG: penicillin-binding protein 1C [Candidatus Zixiibacteriota bacterium]|mgnify:CR=1 FL=1